MIRVQLPYHLRNLAQVGGEVSLAVAPPVTIAAVLDALEGQYPVLRGTIRDHGTLRRRPFLRFFALEQDYSLLPPETELPPEIADGREPFLVIGAIAGGSADCRGAGKGKAPARGPGTLRNGFVREFQFSATAEPKPARRPS